MSTVMAEQTDEKTTPAKQPKPAKEAKAAPKNPARDPEKVRAVDMALAQIEKQFGKGAIMKLDEHSKLQVESIPTGSLSLDIALGVGGIPKGRVIEIYGPESSGKTTLASHMVAEVQ